MTYPLPVPKTLVDFIQHHQTFIIIAHINPDADCICSQLALQSALKRMGKHTVILNSGPFDRKEIQQYQHLFKETIPSSSVEKMPAPAAAIILDCSSYNRIPHQLPCIANLPLAVIDHHITGDIVSKVKYIVPEAPAATMLIASLMHALGLTISSEEAQYLFLGLVTDTAFFRFVDPNQAFTFHAAAHFVQQGAHPRNTDKLINNNYLIENRLITGMVLSRTESLRNNTVLLTYETQNDRQQLGNKTDSATLYRLLFSVKDTLLAVFVKEQENGCSIGFRSTDSINVNALAQEFGGGGHYHAAGAFSADPLEELLQKLRHRFEKL